MHRGARAILIFALAASGACASGGAVPRPFPTPAPSATPGPASAEAPPPRVGRDADGTAAPDEPAIPPAAPGAAVAETALSFRGVRYRAGGTDPDGGFDCSGLVTYVYGQYGVALPRTVAGQYTAGSPVAIDDVREGDLVFFDTAGGGPSHVGIAIGGEAFVHAPNRRGEVRVERLDTPYWTGRLVGIRRPGAAPSVSGAWPAPR